MKEFDFNEEEFEEANRLHGGYDDGAWLTVTTSRIYDGREKVDKKRGKMARRGMVLFHTDLIKTFGEINFCKIFVKEDMLAFKFSKEGEDFNMYKIAKASKYKFKVSSSIIGKYEENKFFKEDILVDASKKIVAVRIKRICKLNSKEIFNEKN